MKDKSEIRNAKSESGIETIASSPAWKLLSVFFHAISRIFGFRISDFGFRVATAYFHRFRSYLWPAFVAVLSFTASNAAAAKLQADLTQPGLRARSEAPIPVEVRFEWDGTRILEGRLELELHEGNRILERYRSSDLALTTGEQRFHFLLPPCAMPYSDSQVEVRMKFVTTSGDALELDPSSLFMPTASQRSLVLAWCNARTEMAAPDFEQTMMLEHFAPQSSEAARKLSLTTLVRFAPEDLPVQALSYTSFDVVVLSADAFSDTGEGQLRSLARWVKGGGSACVFVNGGLQSHHLSFLNGLAESVSDAPTFMADNNGYLLPGEKKIWRLRSGLGRTVIVTGNTPATDSPEWREAVAFLWKFRETRAQAIADTAHWESVTNQSGDTAPITIEEYAAQAQQFRRPNRPVPGTNGIRPNTAALPRALMMFNSIDEALRLTDAEKPKVKAALDDYFKARQNLRNSQPSERRGKAQEAMQLLDAKMKGIMSPEHYAKFHAGFPGRFTPRLPVVQTLNNRIYPTTPYSYGVQESILASQLMGPLLPKTVRLIPFPALLAMLGLFLLAVGPGDYFVLGWFRRRRYTWILFPALSFGFMLATVLMANHFLGARDERRSLIIVDLDKDGTALRWNRYDLIFAARDKQAITEIKDALWVPLNFGLQPVTPYGAMSPGMPSGGLPVNPRYRNSYNTYNVRSYDETETGPALYEGIVPTHFQTSQLIRQWQPRLNRVFSFDSPPVPSLANWREAEAAWPDLPTIRAKLAGAKHFAGDVCAISHSGLHTINGAFPTAAELYPAVFEYQTTFDAGSIQILPPSILSELCIGNSAGLRSVISQISPNGGGSSEDVPAMDDEAGDSALVIVTQSGDNIIVYRRFFHGS